MSDKEVICPIDRSDPVRERSLIND